VVKPSILQRATVWLCLAIAVLTGLTPAQGVVLCLEPDGDLCVEVATAAETCSGCVVDSHDIAPDSDQAVPTQEPCCSCLDLPVPGFSQDRQIVAKSIEFQFGPWVAAPEPFVPMAIPSPHRTAYGTRGEVPRPPDSLALIRSVILLV
jgi:hypothetical protein